MGHRVLKRVPMDFDAPLNSVWKGYINPYSGPEWCVSCAGSGYNSETKKISDDWYSLDKSKYVYLDSNGCELGDYLNGALDVYWGLVGFNTTNDLEAARLFFGNIISDKHWRAEMGYPGGEYWERLDVPLTNGRRYNDFAWQYHLEQDEVEALVKDGRFRTESFLPEVCVVTDLSKKTGNYHFDEKQDKWLGLVDDEWVEVEEPEYPTADIINEWAKTGMGHDSINKWICVEVRAKRLGVWGKCSECKGEGEIKNPDQNEQKRYEEWEEYEPPKGEGYQLWETTTEGSPQSPVFGSAVELAEWCEGNATVLGSEGASKENWLKMIEEQDGLDIGSMGIQKGGQFGAMINVEEELLDK